MTLSVECSFSKVLQTSIAMIHFFGYDFLVPYKQKFLVETKLGFLLFV